MIKIGIGIIIENGNKILLGKRIGEHGFATWSFPGGHLEENETPEECAKRETLEETGLTLIDIIQIIGHTISLLKVENAI